MKTLTPPLLVFQKVCIIKLVNSDTSYKLFGHQQQVRHLSLVDGATPTTAKSGMDFIFFIFDSFYKWSLVF